jgi:hypothetical protein
MLSQMMMVLGLTLVSAGQFPEPAPEGGILPPGPGLGWGFPNGNPDGYGFWDQGQKNAVCTGRTAEYYVQRYMMLPPQQLIFPQYFNPYVMRSQRYIPFTGCNGCHAFSAEISPTTLSMKPYDEGPSAQTKVVNLPRFNGVSETAPINSGSSGLLP